MYRQNEATRHAPKVVEYHSKLVRPLYLLLAALLVVVGLGGLASLQIPRVTCSRSHDDERGTCRIRRYALIGSIDELLLPSEVASFDVQVRTGSKGGKYAEIRLFMTPESHRSTIELTGSWASVAPASAAAARSDFLEFRSGRARSVDRWLSSPAWLVFLTLAGGGLLAFGVVSLREQLSQLRPIRVVVLPEREVVVVRGREVPWREIEDVKVALGRALVWSSGKNERLPGYRLVLIRRSGDDFPVTKEYRAGDPAAHERARDALLRALGRARD